MYHHRSTNSMMVSLLQNTIKQRRYQQIRHQNMLPAVAYCCLLLPVVASLYCPDNKKAPEQGLVVVSCRRLRYAARAKIILDRIAHYQTWRQQRIDLLVFSERGVKV
jgi:hypothetical protein